MDQHPESIVQCCHFGRIIALESRQISAVLNFLNLRPGSTKLKSVPVGRVLSILLFIQTSARILHIQYCAKYHTVGAYEKSCHDDCFKNNEIKAFYLNGKKTR